MLRVSLVVSVRTDADKPRAAQCVAGRRDAAILDPVKIPAMRWGIMHVCAVGGFW